MKRFSGFVIKEFKHIFRDVRTLIILFGMPVIQLLLFGFVITNEIKDAKIAILDWSNDYVTHQITQKIISSEYFILDKYIHSYNEIDKVLKEGNAKLVVIYGANFSENYKKGKASVQLISDASEPNTADMLVNFVSEIINSYVKEQTFDNLPVKITCEPRMWYNPSLKGVFMFVPGIMALLLTLISAMLTSLTITREKELGTMEVLLVSPLRPFQIIIGKVAPYISLSLINSIVIVLIANVVFKVPIVGNVLLLIAECLLYIFTLLMLGILISTISSSQQTAMAFSLAGLMLPTVLLSGFIFPIENMPKILQWFCQIMPPKWFITIIKNIMLKGSSFAYIWKETLILFVMMLIFMVVSIKKFKKRLE